MRRYAFVLLLLVGLRVFAAPGRPASGLRFDANAGASFTTFRVASDGTDFLVLSSHAPHAGSPAALFSQRVTDSRPVGPHRQIAEGSPVGVAWTGTDYLAAWTNANGLWVALVSRDGTLRSTPAEPVLPEGTVAFAAGRHSAMAFRYEESSLVVQPLDLAGRPSRTPVTHTAPAARENLSVGATPNGFAAVFTGWSGTWVMLFRADGTSVTPAPILLDGPYGSTTIDYGSNSSAIATDGTDTLIVFGRGKHNTVAELRSVVIDANGTVKSSHVVEAREGGSAHNNVPAGLVWDGTQYVVAANILYGSADHERRPAVRRIGRNGAPVGELAWLTGDDTNVPYVFTLGSNGRRLLAPVAYVPWPYRTLHAVSIDPVTLRAQAPVVLGRTLSAQNAITIEAGGGGYLAAWSERSANATTIRASRIDAAGNYLDGEGILLDTLSSPLSADSEQSIAVEPNGPQWFVVWRDGWSVRGRSISRAGVPARRAVTIGPGTAADILWNGSHYIVLRSDSSLYKDVMTANGTVAGTTLLAEAEELSFGSITYREPNLLAAGGRLMAIFTEQRDECYIGTPGGCSTTIDVRGLRLDAPGALPFAIAEDTWGELRAASDGTRALATWSAYEGVFGSFVSAEGQAGTPFSLANAGTPSVAYDGNAFVAAWRDHGRPGHVVTARITGSGSIGEKSAIELGVSTISRGIATAASAGLPPLIAFVDQPAEYDSVPRVALRFAHEFMAPDETPAAPAIVCATKHGDETITVRWQAVQDAFGVAIELRLPDGTFRQIGVAAAGATSARVSAAGLPGSAVRLRAWNGAGFSAPSSLTTHAPEPSATVAESIRACAGTPVTINMTLRGTAPFTVRWSDGVVQSNLGQSATRVVTVTRNTTLKIVSVADASCSVDERERTIAIVLERPAAIIEQTRDVRISSGATAALRVTATAESDIAWFEGDPGDTTRPVGTNTDTFTTPALTASMRYWVRVSNRCGSADSAAITVTVGSSRRRAVR